VKRERGESLVEVVIAVAIVALVGTAILGGTLVATHRYGPSIEQTALQDAVHREMRVVVDVMKYQGNVIGPATVATTVPMPGASPAAAHLTIVTGLLGNGATSVSIVASLDADATNAVTLTTTLAPQVPLPSSTLLINGSAPQ